MGVFSSITKEFKRALSDEDLMQGLMIGATLATGAVWLKGLQTAAPVVGAGADLAAAESAFAAGSTPASVTAGSTQVAQAGAQNIASDAATQNLTRQLATGPATTGGTTAPSGVIPQGTIPQVQTAQGVTPQFAPQVTAPSGGFQVPTNEYAVNVPQTDPTLGQTIKSGARSIGSFIKENPMAAALAVNTAAGAFSSDEIDVMREREKIEDERRRKRRGDYAPAGTVSRYMRPTRRAI